MSETDSQNIPQAGTPHGPANATPAPPVPATMNMPVPPAPAQPLPARPAQPHPSQSGPLPHVSGPMQPHAASPLPVAAPAPDYHPPIAGGVNPAGPAGKQPKKRNGLLIFGIVVCLIAAIVLVVALIYVSVRPQAEPLQVDAPTTATMQAAFDEATIKPNGLNSYAYIDDEGLDDPQINDVKAGSVTYGNDGQSANCDATAKASWENDSVSVEQTVQIPFSYNVGSSSWQAGTPSGQTASLKVTPKGPADVEAIQEALPGLLQNYDAEIAKQFTSPEIAATAELDSEGGQITFALDQETDGNHVQTDVTVKVVWEDGKGWVPTIDHIGEIIGALPPAEGEGEGSSSSASSDSDNGNGNNNGGSQSNGGDDAQMLLTCTTGDLVEVPGVIEYRDNRVLLRSDYTIRVVLDGRTYVAKYFELTANTFVVTNGAHVSVVGEISATGGLEQAPLMLNLDYEG